MAKKWAHLRGTVPAFDGEPSERRKKLETRKEDYAGRDLKDLAISYEHRRDEKDRLEADLKVAQFELDAVQESMLVLMEEQDLESVSTSSGSTFSRNPSPHPVVADRDALRGWLEKQDMLDMLTLNFQTLRGIVSERILDGLEVPDGVELFTKESVRRRKA